MQVHADRIFDHLRRTGLRIGRLGAFRLQVPLDIFFADHLHTQSLKDLQVLVGLNRIHDGGRQNLVQLLIGDVPAVGLAATLHVLNDVVEFGLSQNRHAFHGRKDGIGVGCVRRLVFSCNRQRRLSGRLLARRIIRLGLRPLDFRRQRLRVQRRRFDFVYVFRRQIVPIFITHAALRPFNFRDFLGNRLLVFLAPNILLLSLALRKRLLDGRLLACLIRLNLLYDLLRLGHIVSSLQFTHLHFVKCFV